MLVARIEALIYRILRFAAAGHRLLLACSALSFVGTLTAAWPVTAVVVPATLMAAGRWRAISGVAALGSAIGATVLMVVFHHLGWTQLYERFPELATDPSWVQAVDWGKRYGTAALFLIAASPLPQTPALMFFGAMRPDYAGVFMAMLAGKLLKYGIFAWISSHFPERVGRSLGALRRRGRKQGTGDSDV
ncbi:hypothetical protein [Aromatoleum petrolei]|uniref:DedA family protein n=1 Tax=Aromatoleum petrolei TaxID=76116 RepID=A0ABX1MZ09_9RHOO|nr:hypothetical protein [Aromatoleum petrolei]NMF90282.1 hypothetical protein [Aromatoleum petrolei]QTQ35556.1 Uncharacterized protein ToN1_13960 [Aromatoleum petrolei]